MESGRASTCSSCASSVVSVSSETRSNAASSASTTAASVSGSDSTSLVAPDGSVPQLIAESTTPNKAPKRRIGIDAISYHIRPPRRLVQDETAHVPGDRSVPLLPLGTLDSILLMCQQNTMTRLKRT